MNLPTARTIHLVEAPPLRGLPLLSIVLTDPRPPEEGAAATAATMIAEGEEEEGAATTAIDRGDHLRLDRTATALETAMEEEEEEVEGAMEVHRRPVLWVLVATALRLPAVDSLPQLEVYLQVAAEATVREEEEEEEWGGRPCRRQAMTLRGPWEVEALTAVAATLTRTAVVVWEVPERGVELPQSRW